MSRYIDADHLKKSAEALQDCYNGYSDTYDKACIIGLIDEEPTADVVEVVRCKDCKKYAREEWKRKLDEPHNFADTEWKIEFSGCMGFDDPEKGYCYAGERKGES